MSLTMRISFLLPLLVLFGCATQTASVEEASLQYAEKHRPQYHFSPPTQWMNDPNGMVFYEGEYHLFYQYYPDSNVWGPMHWGHAVSKDLISWEHLPIAIYPDELGYIFSGSIVVDWENTSGFGVDNQPPLVAIFTQAVEDEKAIPQKQSIAYSHDKGRTWSMFEGNPVIDEDLRAFRDPKVFWHAPSANWIMSLAATTDNVGIRPDHIRFYASKDLKAWNKLSEFGYDIGSQAGKWECPDLFKMRVEGSKEEKWVLLVSINLGGPQGGSATQYFVGDFDGETFQVDDDFIPEGDTAVWLDYGADNYAGVTWSDIPKEDGRRLFIGWMSNWDYAQVVPTYTWRSAMTLPRELVLHRSGSSYRVHSRPVQEISSYIGDELDMSQLTDSAYVITARVEGEFELTLANALGEEVILRSTSNQFIIDRSKSGKVDFGPGFGTLHVTDLNGIEVEQLQVFVDASSIEVFVNDGELVMTELIFPNEPYHTVRVRGTAGISIRSLASIW